MSLTRPTRDVTAPGNAQADRQGTAGQVVLFIIAVLIAGMTSILYLWQQSRIVAANQDITQLNSVLVQRLQQRDDLLAQVQRLQAVTHVVAEATKYGMIQADSRQFKQLTVTTTDIRTTAVAQLSPSQRPAVALPATNAAITYWWQDAWDGLYSLLQ